MVSMSTERWSTPRPYTMNESALGPGFTLRARFFSSSFSRRSFKCLEVTNLPSFPKNGELLMQKSMLIVGSSTSIGGRASGFSKSAIVSPISKPSRPTTAQMSPHWTSSTLAFPSPSKTMISLIFCFCIMSYLLQRVMFIPAFRLPLVTRPTAIRPTYGEYSSDEMSICGVPSCT